MKSRRNKTNQKRNKTKQKRNKTKRKFKTTVGGVFSKSVPENKLAILKKLNDIVENPSVNTTKLNEYLEKYCQYGTSGMNTACKIGIDKTFGNAFSPNYTPTVWTNTKINKLRIYLKSSIERLQEEIDKKRSLQDYTVSPNSVYDGDEDNDRDGIVLLRNTDCKTILEGETDFRNIPQECLNQ